MFYGGGNQWEEIENVGKSGGKNIGRELSGRGYEFGGSMCNYPAIVELGWGEKGGLSLTKQGSQSGTHVG